MLAGGDWTPHKVEMAVWTFYVLREFKPESLEDLPEASARRVATELAESGANGVNGEVSNGDSEAAEADEATEGNTEAVLASQPVTSSPTNTDSASEITPPPEMPEVTTEVTPEVTPKGRTH